MSILAVVPLVKEFNKDKPSLFDPTVQRTLYEEDYKKIEEITQAVAAQKLPYKVQVIVRGQCKQIYLRCLEIKPTDKPGIQRVVSIPDIHKTKTKA